MMNKNVEQYRVTLVDSTELPSALVDDWNRLAGDMTLHRWEWYQPWWQHYRAEQNKLNILVVHNSAQQVCGIAPWYQTRNMTAGRSLRFLGDNEICTDYQSLLLAPSERTAARQAIGSWLLTTGRGTWDLLDWRGKIANDPDLEALCAQLVEQGSAVHRLPLEHVWRVPLEPTWDGFLRTHLSKGRREKIRYLERKYFNKDRVRLHTLESAEQVDEYLAILIQLHQSRRQELGQPGCFSCPQFTAFHRTVMHSMATLGRLRLQYIELDGSPAAASYAFIGNRGIYYYQSGMDVARSHDKPGWLCQIAAIKLAIEQGLQFWDFLRGDEPYKASWGATPTLLMQRRISAPQPLAQLRHAAWVAGYQVRQWAKRTWQSSKSEAQVTELSSPASTECVTI